MTHLTTITGSFQAKVVAARLGAEGIPAQLRGGIDGVYPIFDEVRVYVPEDQVEVAREILLADAVDAVFDEAGLDDTGGAGPSTSSSTRGRSPARLVALTMLVIVVLVIVGYVAVMGGN